MSADRVYTNTETGTLLNRKASSSYAYPNAATDMRFTNTANIADISDTLALKANTADFYTGTDDYTKTETDTSIFAKTNRINPTSCRSRT